MNSAPAFNLVDHQRALIHCHHSVFRMGHRFKKPLTLRLRILKIARFLVPIIHMLPVPI